jgi:hypothetical protein
MAKKSRKTAARYSELSKAKKKKSHDKPPVQTGTVSVSTSQKVVEPGPVKSQVPRAVARPLAELKRGIPSYQYVRADLKKIGILAGGMVLILIILSFALG